MIVSTGKWRSSVTWLITAFVFAATNLTITGATKAAPYLETNRACSGAPLSKSERFKITGWDGRSRRSQGEQVYSFRVECKNSERDIIDAFLASENSNRFKRDGNTLSQWVRNTSQSVKTREAGCSQVPKRVRSHPSSAEVRAACRGQRMPMACEIDMLAQVRWETRMVEECWRAQFERREVPVWNAFPAGFAPLPRGARIVQVGGTTAGATSSPAGGSGIWPFLFVVLAAGGTIFYFYRKNQGAFQEQVASARSQMHGSESHFGAHFDNQDPHSSGADQSYENFSGEDNFGTTDQTNYETAYEQPQRSPDDLPETLEEACALLNVTPDTPLEQVNKAYHAMVKVWQVDTPLDEPERKRREAKFKQLNAAKEFIDGKR